MDFILPFLLGLVLASLVWAITGFVIWGRREDYYDE